MFNEEDKRKVAAAPTWRLINGISAPAGNSLHTKVVKDQAKNVQLVILNVSVHVSVSGE